MRMSSCGVCCIMNLPTLTMLLITFAQSEQTNTSVMFNTTPGTLIPVSISQQLQFGTVTYTVAVVAPTTTAYHTHNAPTVIPHTLPLLSDQYTNEILPHKTTIPSSSEEDYVPRTLSPHTTRAHPVLNTSSVKTTHYTVEREMSTTYTTTRNTKVSRPALPSVSQTAIPPSSQTAIPPFSQSTIPPFRRPTSSQSAIPPSSETVVSPSFETAIPPSSQTAILPSSQTVIPPSSQTAIPPSSQTVIPPSSQTAIPPYYSQTAIPQFSRPAMPPFSRPAGAMPPIGRPPFSIPSRPPVVTNDNLDIIIAITVLVAILLIVSGIGIAGLVMVYRYRAARRRVGDRPSTAARGAGKRRDTPWHLYYTEPVHQSRQ